MHIFHHKYIKGDENSKMLEEIIYFYITKTKIELLLKYYKIKIVSTFKIISY